MNPLPMHSPIAGSTVWTRSTLDWQSIQITVTAEQCQAACEEAQLLLECGKSLNSAVESDFAADLLRELVDEVDGRLTYGVGCCVLRGLVDMSVREDVLKLVFWGFGALLGKPRLQNPQGDRIHSVARAESDGSGAVRAGSVGDNEIFLHTENARPPGPPRLIALMCMQAAAQGGESILMSGHTVHNRLLETRPEVLPRLYSPFEFGRHPGVHFDGRRIDASPVFWAVDDRVSVRYGRYWVSVAEETTGRKLDATSVAALDAFDEVLADRSLAFTFSLGPGDVVIVQNQTVLHGRSAFLDDDAAGRKRRLLRLWID